MTRNYNGLGSLGSHLQQQHARLSSAVDQIPCEELRQRHLELGGEIARLRDLIDEDPEQMREQMREEMREEVMREMEAAAANSSGRDKKRKRRRST